MKISILICIALVPCCYPFQPEITLYNGYGYTGDSITFRTKTPNLVAKAPTFVHNWKSCCFNGWWLFYTSLNYYGVGSTTGTIHFNQSLYCYNNTNGQDPYTGSVRFIGPTDTATSTISVYSNTTMAGDELIIEAPAYTNIPFVPKSVLVTGSTPWTIFSEENFSGTASCIVPNSGGYYVNINLSSLAIASVYRGCLTRRIDKYLYADNIDIIDIEIY